MDDELRKARLPAGPTARVLNLTPEQAGEADALLKAVWTPELEPLFWRSDRVGVESAWYGHVPFAHWIVAALSPRCIVELGTHNGVSYAAFCGAVQRQGLGTRCFAVDTWAGDAQAGFYGEDVFNGLRQYHDQRFGAFSTLVRSAFEDALGVVPDGTVDLLHIDGLHTYDAVRRDFDSWRGKLSGRAVVLFHDTNVREGAFGVWKLWAELQQEHPSFEFLHAHGLGVLAVGPEVPALVGALTGLHDIKAVGAVRERFAQLGERCILDAQLRLQHGALVKSIEHYEAAATRLGVADAELAQMRPALEQARLEAGQAQLEAEHALSERDQAQAQAAQLRSDATLAQSAAALAQSTAALAQSALQAELAAARQALADAQAEISEARQAEAISRERAEAAQARAEEAARAARLDHAEALARERDHQAQARAAQTQFEAERDARLHEARRRERAEDTLSEVLDSSMWKATWPLRQGLQHLPEGVRRPARHAGRTIWRTLTPQFRGARAVAPAPGPVPLAVQAPDPAPSVTLPAPISVPTLITDGRASGPCVHFSPCVRFISGEPDTPGSIYRVERYVAACNAAGADVRAWPLDQVAGHHADMGQVDVLVVWRAKWTEALAALVAQARANQARIVFDVDDLMIDPALATVEVIDGIRSQNLTEEMVQEHFLGVQQTMLAADFCSASTPELAGQMRRFGKTSFTLPNGFDVDTLHASRMAARRRQAAEPDGLVRIGYAGGSRTHQRDFAEIAGILPSLLAAHPNCRLVLFQSGKVPLVDIEEFPGLDSVAGQIEWRDLVPLHLLPGEIARFDVNLAPLQVGNPFCEAKSELKYFEGALAGVCTVASPTGPYARAIRDGVTGYLAATPAQWEEGLTALLADPALRRRMAQAALNEVLWTYSPERRAQLMRHVLAEWQRSAGAADGFALELGPRSSKPRPGPSVPAGEVVFSADRLGQAEVTVAIPLFNYAHTVVETLDSVLAQTLHPLDLVIVEDASTDRSLGVALEWARTHAERFNRIMVVRNHVNAGLAQTRNAAFAAAETPYVLPLDADNLLRPSCCETLLASIRESRAAFVYPVIQQFGGRTSPMGDLPYDPARLVGGNYIDAMALVAKSAWSAAGGYAQGLFGWEDYDFWCSLAEIGLSGAGAGGLPLADYRVHAGSMLHQVTETPEVKHRVIQRIEQRHPWLSVMRPPEPAPGPASTPEDAGTLERLLPILRCPETKAPLQLVGGMLQTPDASRAWPLKAGRPILFPGMPPDDVKVFTHLSNELPESALALIRASRGLVLNLSAGGTAERFDHVVEAEAAIFRHTDVVADSHALPFVDEAFEAVIVMNAFEHYRDPRQAAAEIHRVLQPGGRILVRTAFLQPQHEAPWHFYNVTKFGLLEWFAQFETEQLHVSDNFNPSYAIAWLASECEAALHRDVGLEAAQRFAAEPAGQFAQFWRDPASRTHRAWTDFRQLSQPSQEAVAAGFEYLGRRAT